LIFLRFRTSVGLNEGDDFALSVGITLDIPRSRLKACMTRELLDVAQ
jgi:hypothetical protein